MGYSLSPLRGSREWRRKAELECHPLESRKSLIIDAGKHIYWIAECAGLPGCITGGNTGEDAIESASQAIRESIAALEEDRIPVPPETFGVIVVAV